MNAYSVMRGVQHLSASQDSKPMGVCDYEPMAYANRRALGLIPAKLSDTVRATRSIAYDTQFGALLAIYAHATLSGENAEEFKRLVAYVDARPSTAAGMKKLVLDWWMTDMDHAEFWNRSVRLLGIVNEDLDPYPPLAAEGYQLMPTKLSEDMVRYAMDCTKQTGPEAARLIKSIYFFLREAAAHPVAGSSPDDDEKSCYCGGWTDSSGAYHQDGCPEIAAEPVPASDDPIGDMQAEDRQAKLDDFVRSVKPMPASEAANIDTPEFRKLLLSVREAKKDIAVSMRIKLLIAYINAHLAAPTAQPDGSLINEGTKIAAQSVRNAAQPTIAPGKETQ